MTIKQLCPHCGSDNIIRDACAEWDGAQWVLLGLYDNMTCNDCEREFYETEEQSNVGN